MTAATCNKCGGPKPADRFRACPDCRAAWRVYDARKRGQRPSEVHRRTVTVDVDVLDALRPAAEARGLSVNELARRLLATIADEAMTDAVLDDRDRPNPKKETA